MSVHTYGHGICTDDIHTTVDKIKALIAMAPNAYELCVDAFKDAENDEITRPDEFAEYMGQGWDGHEEAGLATLLAVVINECEGIDMYASMDDYGNTFLIMQEKLPWHCTHREKNLTEDGINAIIRKYVSVLTDDEIEIKYQEIECA